MADLPSIELSVFGPGQLRVDGVDVIGPGKSVFLLAYLGCQPQRRAGRARIIDLLWGDVPATRARVTLRQTLLQLRRRLSGDLFIADSDDLQLTPVVHFDRDAMLASFEAHTWDRVVQLAAAPFLDRAATPGGEAFERWAEGERQRCRDLVETAIVAATRLHIAAGRAIEAIALALYWRDSDRSHEIAGRHLVATLLELGEHARGRLEAQALEASLLERREAISPATKEVLDRARSVSGILVTPIQETVLQPELVGRASLFASLVADHRASRRGRSLRDLLVGPAGIGKTRLLEALAARLTAHGGDVTIMRAFRAAQEVEGAALSDLVSALGVRRGAAGVSTVAARVLTAVSPSLERVFLGAPALDRASIQLPQLVQATEELLRVLCEERPLTLLFDDTHWWDATSTTVISAVLARCESEPLFVVATSRRNLPEFPGENVYTIGHLAISDVEALVRSIADADAIPVDEVVGALHRASGGVPQLVLEAVHWLLDCGSLALRPQGWELLDAELLQELNSDAGLLDERFKKLAGSATRVIEWLAAAQEPLPKTLFGPIDPRLEDGGFIRVEEDTVSLSHETIGDRVIARMSANRRGETSGELAAALLARSELTRHQLRIAGQVAVASADGQLCTSAFERWRASSRGSRAPVSSWSAFLGLPYSTVRPLLPTASIWWRDARQRVLAIGGIAAAGIATLVILGGRPAATHLVIPGEQQRFVQVVSGSLLPSIAVEGRSSSGSLAAVSRSLEMLVHGVGISLSGVVQLKSSDGRFEFTNVRVTGNGAGRIWFRHPGFDSTPGPWVIVGEGYRGKIAIENGIVAGQELKGERPEIHVRAGTLLRGKVSLHVLTLWPNASVILGAVARWGPREQQWLTLMALAPESDTSITVTLSDSLAQTPSLVAPSVPGRYQLLLLAGAETEFRYIASGTNWTVGRPIWDAEHSVAGWPAATVDRLARDGYAIVPMRYSKGGSEAIRIGSVIDVIVDSERR